MMKPACRALISHTSRACGGSGKESLSCCSCGKEIMEVYNDTTSALAKCALFRERLLGQQSPPLPKHVFLMVAYSSR